MTDRRVGFFTPPGTMEPLGPYSHVALAGDWIMIGAVAGVDPRTDELASTEVQGQTQQIIAAFDHMLKGVGSSLGNVLHVTVYLKSMDDYAEMNAAYAQAFGAHRPARSVVAVSELPKPGALLTMSLTAVKAPD